MCVGGVVCVWGGGDRVGGREYTPLYKNGIKKVRNKSMETEVLNKLVFLWTSYCIKSRTFL